MRAKQEGKVTTTGHQQHWEQARRAIASSGAPMPRTTCSAGSCGAWRGSAAAHPAPGSRQRVETCGWLWAGMALKVCVLGNTPSVST